MVSSACLLFWTHVRRTVQVMRDECNVRCNCEHCYYWERIFAPVVMFKAVFFGAFYRYPWRCKPYRGSNGLRQHFHNLHAFEECVQCTRYFASDVHRLHLFLSFLHISFAFFHFTLPASFAQNAFNWYPCKMPAKYYFQQ